MKTTALFVSVVSVIGLAVLLAVGLPNRAHAGDTGRALAAVAVGALVYDALDDDRYYRSPRYYNGHKYKRKHRQTRRYSYDTYYNYDPYYYGYRSYPYRSYSFRSYPSFRGSYNSYGHRGLYRSYGGGHRGYGGRSYGGRGGHGGRGGRGHR